MSQSSATTQSPSKIRDLVEVQTHPTVVRLDHLEEESAKGRDADWITSAYHVTEDVAAHLESLRRVLSDETGCGMFLIGQYGSGKSHFLAYVARSLEQGTLGSGSFVESPPAVLAISMLNFRAEMMIEEIVSGELGVEVGHGDRREAWARVSESYPRGLLLVLDELSEFLRSKSDRRRFNEDVRFLQFLGEWAQGQRFWLLAAMQEQIEHTGDLDDDLYRKIKDRYPLRYFLSPAHVADLVASSILVKKQGYLEAVDELLEGVRAAMPDSPLDFDLFRSIYPVHPATLTLLEEVRDRFSQTRGVVDFAVTRLRGDAERDIPAFLDEPWGSLIGPDAIVSHFEDLFEFQPEFLPLGQRVLPWYEKHLDQLFDRPKLRALAQRVLQLLILTHLSPARDGLTVADAVYWLVPKATRVDPERNVRIIEKVLMTFVESGRYVGIEEGVYSLRLDDDSADVLDRRLEREKTELANWGDGVFEIAVSLLGEDDFHPFRLPRDEWQARSVTWSFHRREFQVFCGNGETRSDAPIAICIRMPWGDAHPAPGTWTLIPDRLTPDEDIVELAALVRIRDRVGRGELLEKLEGRLARLLASFRARVRTSMLESQFVGPTGSVEESPRGDPKLPFREWLELHALWILKRRYPSFESVAPTGGPLPKEAYRRFWSFVTAHGIEDAGADDYVQLVREAYLVPLALLQKRGRKYAVPKKLETNEVVKVALRDLDAKPSPRTIEDQLATGPYGLVPDQVRLLLVQLLALGEIDLLRGEKSYRDLWEEELDPLAYDQVVAGRSLSLAELRSLEGLADGFGVRSPKDWTVTGQRRVVEELRVVGAEQSEDFSAVCRKLGESEEAKSDRDLASRLEEVVTKWSVLAEDEAPLVAFVNFLEAIGEVPRFVAAVTALADIPDRFEKLSAELERFRYLFAHPLLSERADASLLALLRDLGPAPGLGDPDGVEMWIDRARSFYDEYKAEYTRRHKAWWDEIAAHDVWDWRGPPLASSDHLGLRGDLESLAACRERARGLRCSELLNLDFQPLCACGFDGASGPVASVIEEFDERKTRLFETLEAFFARDDVRARVEKWAEDDLGDREETGAYLRGEASVPAIRNLDLFDTHMSGVELVREVDLFSLCDELVDEVWSREDLLRELTRRIDALGAARVRVVRRNIVDTDQD